MTNTIIYETVAKAANGDKTALNEVIRSIDKLVYNLSIKMLWNIDDAEDASQEILIKVITNLGSFEGKSSFITWVYRLATNYLLSHLSRKARSQTVHFDELSQSLAEGVIADTGFTENTGEQNLLVQEIKIGCTNGMLQCLDKDSRVTYILGDILNFNSTEGSAILKISPATFRKRLSRARELLYAFMQANCGIAQPKNSCRCQKQIDHCMATKKINPRKLNFATHGEDMQLLQKITFAEDTISLFRTNPEYEMPENSINELKTILNIIER